MALGFDWSSLPAGSTIVDVGSGLGHIAMKVFKKYPALKVVIQDRASVIEQAKAVIYCSLFSFGKN